MARSFVGELKLYLDSGYPALLVETPEYVRLEMEILQAKNGHSIYFWNLVEGLIQVGTDKDNSGQEKQLGGNDPVEVLTLMLELPEKSLVVMRDLHRHVDNSMVICLLQQVFAAFKRLGSTVIFSSCQFKLPPEIEKEVAHLPYALPDANVLGTCLTNIIGAAQKERPELQVTEPEREEALRALRGLTTIEAENALSKSITETGRIAPEVIVQEKMKALEATGYLTFYETIESMEDVGGLDGLKTWFRRRKRAFSEKAKVYGLQTPRGVLIIGVSGCGKSLAVKGLSSLWHLPLLRFDVSAIFGSLVGESEAAMRSAQKRAEALAPVLLWVDEIEKAFSGVGAGSSLDSGVSERVFGSFLTWMQEKKAEVFVCATANDVSALPPELLRKGRFDEIFFVDLPTPQEREAILEIHLRKRGRKSEKFELDELVKVTDGFTGAEIEEAINDAMFAAFDEEREFTTQDIKVAVEATSPLSKFMGEKVATLRAWAKNRTRSASGQVEKKTKRGGGPGNRHLGGVQSN